MPEAPGADGRAGRPRAAHPQDVQRGRGHDPAGALCQWRCQEAGGGAAGQVADAAGQGLF